MKISTSAPAGRRRHLSHAALVGAGALLLSGLAVTAAEAVINNASITIAQGAGPVTVGSPINGTLAFDSTVAANITSVVITAAPVGSINLTMVAAGDDCGGASITAGPGPQTVTFTDAALPAGGTCTVNFQGIAATATAGATLSAALATDEPDTENVVSAPPLVISQANPAIVSIASKNGASITDTATVSGRVNPVNGTLTFNLYGPDDATCSGPIIDADIVAIGAGNGPFTSSPFTVTAPGTYRYTLSYSGDVNNSAVPAACNAPGESVTVTQADIDGTPPGNNPPGNNPPACPVNSPNTGNNNRGYGNSGNNNRGNCNSGNNNRGDNNSGNNNRN